MKFNKKYTMEEFEEMFNKAQREAIDKLEKDWKEALEKDDNYDTTKMLGFTLQNLLAFQH